MKIATPIALIFLTGSMLSYFFDIDETKAISWGWGVFFHCSWCYSLSLFLSIILYRYELESPDKDFLLIADVYSFILGTAFVLNYYDILERESFLIITSTAILVTTIMIAISGVRHGIFRN